ncbi:MAG TPA: MFS transporter [Gaiellaceae bacterium]|nr:MFS transporter [Gaiellaceae bacterium]
MRRLVLLVGAVVFVDTVFYAALTPLLPVYAEELGLSKAGAGVLAGAYAAGALAGGIPGGVAAARLGVKPTLLIGLAGMAATTFVFGIAEHIVLLDAMRFLQGFASAFSWTAALTWLVAAAPPDRRGELIGTAMAAAIVGALFGPVLGGAASIVGTAPAFATVGLLAGVLGVWAWRTPAFAPADPQPLRLLFAAVRRPRIAASIWFVALPAMLFGTLGVLAPLRLSELGLGSVAIGATFLVAAGLEAVVNPFVGRFSDRRGRMLPLRAGLVASATVAVALPWFDHRLVLAAAVVAAGMAFGIFWAPAMSMLADAAEAIGLDYAYAFALINLAWAPFAALGAAGSGTVAGATSDAVPYVGLAAACVATFVVVARYSERRRTGALAAGANAPPGSTNAR